MEENFQAIAVARIALQVPEDERDIGRIIAAVDASQDALDALEASDALRQQLTPLLHQCTSALQKHRAERGQRPSMGCKRRDVVDRADESLRPLRAAAHDAMHTLLDIVWRPLTSAERKQNRSPASLLK